MSSAVKVRNLAFNSSSTSSATETLRSFGIAAMRRSAAASTATLLAMVPPVCPLAGDLHLILDRNGLVSQQETS